MKKIALVYMPYLELIFNSDFKGRKDMQVK